MKYGFMRVIILLTFFYTSPIHAQWGSVIIDFDGYNGTIATAPPFTFISWNSVNPPSFYTSAGNYNASAPSYKFGNDGDYIISKEMPAVDSISFWLKGNGAPFSVDNELRIYHSNDSINWVILYTLDSLPTSGSIYTFPISQLDGQFKFEYFKAPAGGNLAIDDITLYSNIVFAQSEILLNKKINIFPSPTRGILNIHIEGEKISMVEIYDILGNSINYGDISEKGNEVYTINMSHLKKGFYILKIQYGDAVITRRITLTE